MIWIAWWTKKARVSRAYLWRLEMGRHDPPLSRLRQVAAALRLLIERGW